MKIKEAGFCALVVCACVIAAALVIGIHVVSGELCAHHVLRFC